jgi:diguanylate cyclase (GGDEF)-like protein/putative nucleotidyltransferase with HDIG domain
MTWSELPTKLKLYIGLLTSLAVPIIIWAILDLLYSKYNFGWWILATLTLITVRFFLYLPSANATIGIGDAYIMAIAMMYGVAPCVITTLLHTLIISLFAKRPRIPLYRIFFNIGSMVCGAWLYSTIYQMMNGGSVKISDVILPAVILVTTYFLVNSTLTSIAIAWSIGESILKFWTKTCMPLAIAFSVSAVLATSIVVLHSFSEWVPLGAAPIVGLLWGWHNVNKTRMMEAEKHLKEQEQLYLRTVESLALAVDAKDQTTYGHIRRVRVYATGLAKLCGIKDPNELMAIETGSLLHDIGKIAIDDYILNKPGRLSKQEFEKIKMHASAGDEILQQVRFPFPVAKYVRCHHERWDGLGYPDGLKGEDIPLGARILAIADAFDAIRFSRPYKLPIALDDAIDLMRAQSGTVYDPRLIQLFIENIDKLEYDATRASENVPELSFRKYFEKVDRDISAADLTSPCPTTSVDIPTELLRLSEFCNTLIGHFSLPDTFSLVSRKIARIVPFTTCVFYIDNGKNSVRAEYATGKFSEVLCTHTLEMGKGISGWVTAYKRPMVNTGPALDFQGIAGDFNNFIDALVVPIMHGKESFGTISLYSEAPVTYNSNDLATIQMIAGFLGPLLSDYKKYEKSEGDNYRDPITQLHYVSYLDAISPQLLSFAEKNSSPISMIILEIKNLHKISRIFGKIFRNAVLHKFSECIKHELRETDILVRYGQNGFVALLPGVRNDQALRCVQRLNQHIKKDILTINGQLLPCDYRTAISSYPKDGATIISLLQSAQENISSIEMEDVAPESKVVDFFPRS